MTEPDATRIASLMALTVALGPLARSYKATADRAVAPLGISQTLAWPLVMLHRLGDTVRQGVLAEALGIEGPSLVRSLDQLVDAGLAERREDPADRRAKTLHVTPAGLAACAQIEAALHGLRGELFDGVTDRDIAACLRVFSTLGARMGAVMPAVPVAAATAALAAAAATRKNRP